MRKQEEIDRQIQGLEKMKDSLPETNFFGENNWEPIDAQLDILRGGRYDDYRNDKDSVESAAYRAQNWLDDDNEEDLFDEE